MRGGKRPNAGRPKGSKASHTLQAQIFRSRLIQRILEEQEPIIQTLIDQAKAGHPGALREVLDRALGKSKLEEPKERVFLPGQIIIKTVEGRIKR